MPERPYHPTMPPSRPLQTYEGREVTVTFDARLCIHSEECVRGLPAVFEPPRKCWIRPDAAAVDEVLAVVARCPSGALRAHRAGATGNPPFCDGSHARVRFVSP